MNPSALKALAALLVAQPPEANVLPLRIAPPLDMPRIPWASSESYRHERRGRTKPSKAGNRNRMAKASRKRNRR